MSGALIRFARRLTSWEKPSLPLDELQRIEFTARDGGPDLRVSVSEVDDFATRVVQTYAEHAAHRFDPPRSALAIDVASAVASPPLPVPAETPFAFTRDGHREVLFDEVADLFAFIERVRSAPQRVVRKSDVQSYVRTQLKGADPEWTAAASASGAKGWVMKLAAKP